MTMNLSFSYLDRPFPKFSAFLFFLLTRFKETNRPTTCGMETSRHMQALLSGPAKAPPLGIKPNFDNPQNQSANFVLTIVLTVTISTFALLIRMYTKIRIIRKVGWEDCTTIFLSTPE